jgi:hypothetical protein
MANRDTDFVKTPKSEVHILTAKIVGGGAAADPTRPDSTRYGGGEFATCIYAGSTGTYSGTFRKKYPELLSLEANVVGVTAGLKIRFTAIDVAAGTFAFTAEVNTTATDIPTTSTVFFTFYVRNSGRN